jgi:hypothetical protein
MNFSANRRFQYLSHARFKSVAWACLQALRSWAAELVSPRRRFSNSCKVKGQRGRRWTFDS